MDFIYMDFILLPCLFCSLNLVVNASSVYVTTTVYVYVLYIQMFHTALLNF